LALGEERAHGLGVCHDARPIPSAIEGGHSILQRDKRAQRWQDAEDMCC
jgi:hypothetical protein